MRPNPDGDVDDEIVCCFLLDEEGSPRTILINTAVHPTTLGVSLRVISADYPGIASARLREPDLFGKYVRVLPLQGACGDVRPMVLDCTGDEFMEGTEADMDRIGSRIAEAVFQSFCRLEGKNKVLWIDGSGFLVASSRIDLPLAPLPSRKSLETLIGKLKEEITKPADHSMQTGFAAAHDNPILLAKAFLVWAENLLNTAFDTEGIYIGPKDVPARFSFIALGPALQIFSFPGEAFCTIGKALKQKAKPASLMVCGYSGGSVGYMPTSKACLEGGYEVESAYRLYGYPAPLAAGTEALLYHVFDAFSLEASPTTADIAGVSPES